MKKKLNEEQVVESMVASFMKLAVTQPNFMYQSAHALKYVSSSVGNKVENEIQQVLTLAAVNTVGEVNA